MHREKMRLTKELGDAEVEVSSPKHLESTVAQRRNTRIAKPLSRGAGSGI